jgi:hypothetical protein
MRRPSESGRAIHSPNIAGDIEFVRLPEIDTASLSRLVNDPRVLRHMPLGEGGMSEADLREWIRGKERIWDEYGFGPLAIRIKGMFAGVGWPPALGRRRGGRARADA